MTTSPERFNTPLTQGNESAIDAGVQHLIQAATSENTRQTYRSAIRQFEKWGGRLPCNSDALLHYIRDKSTILNPRTLDLHLTAISQWHRFQHLPDPTHTPTVKKVLKGNRRLHAKPKHKAKAFDLISLKRLVEHLDGRNPSSKLIRDKALILMGFFGGFRRSELATLTMENISWHSDGMIINLTKSKTNQECDDQLRAIPASNTAFCAVAALKKWLQIANITEGFIFRGLNRWEQVSDASLSPASVNTILKEHAAQAGLNDVELISSHSLRRGMATSAGRAGIDFALIKKQGGWKQDSTVWGYIDEGRIFENNASLQLLKAIEEI
ncbi:MAG: site-specific integrase [Agarilytica sp.]